jgi:hypothetical protein
MTMKWAAIAALLAWSGAARAHELACSKWVAEGLASGGILDPGPTWLVSAYPVTLRFVAALRNTHPADPSQLVSTSDPLLESIDPTFRVRWSMGAELTEGPLWIPAGEVAYARGYLYGDVVGSPGFELVLDSYEECRELAARMDAEPGSRPQDGGSCAEPGDAAIIDNVLYARWAGGLAACTARIVCVPPAPEPQPQ